MVAVPAWLSRWKVYPGGTWAAHVARGSKGGVDYAAPHGTLILAASDGIVDYRLLSDGSSVARVTRTDGTATEMLHGVPKGRPRTVRHNEVIATSDGREGAWGAGRSTGPHIHAHDVDKGGNRRPPFSTIPSGGGAGGGYTPEGEGDQMPIVVENKDAKTRVWSVFDPAFAGTTVAERGYLETTDLARARRWVLRYMPAADGAYQWSAENYKAGQVESRLLHEAWQRGGASGGSSGVTAAEIRAILEPLFAGVNANIDDQPTTFKVTPS